MADGTLLFKTTLDESGLVKGLNGIKGVAKTAFGVSAKAVSAMSGALSAGAAAAIKVGSSFESGMSQVAAVSGATGEELDALTEKAKEMGAKTKFSATESAEAMNYMAMAGWKTEDMLNGIEGIMNLAAASGEDLATTSDIVTDALTAFGMSAADSIHFADVLAAASSNANTNVSMMGETFKYVAPVAGTLGFSAEDTATAIGLMANSGIKAGQAGTSLRAIMNRLASPTNEVQTAMDALGVSITNSDGSMKSLNEIMVDLRKGFSGLSEAEKANMASAIGGQEAMSGLLAIVSASDDDFNKLQESIYGCDGAAEQMAETMQNNLQGQITILKSALEGLGIEIYEQMSEELTDTVKLGQDIINQLTETFKEEGPNGLVSALGDVLAELITRAAEYAPQMVELACQLLASLAQGLIDNAPKIGEAAGQILLIFIESIANNIPQIMNAGKRFVDGFLQGISESFPGVGSFLQGLFDGVSESLEPIIDGLVSCFSKLFDTFNDADPDKMYKIGKALGEIAVAIGGIKISKSTITLIRDLFKALKGNAFIGTVGKVVEGFQLFAGGAGTLSEVIALEFPAISTAIGSMSGWASTAGGALASLGGTITSGISSVVAALGGPLLIAIAAAIAAVIAIICNWDEVKKFFTETLPAWWENTVVPFFSELGEKFITALNEFGEKTIDFLKSCLDHVVEFFSDLPYKIGYALGVLLGKIIQFGIDFWGWVTTELPNIITGIIEWFKTLPERVWEWLLNTIVKVITWGGEMQKNGKEAVKKFLEKAIETIKELPGKIWEWLKTTAGKVVDWKEDMKKKAKDAMSAFSENVQEAIKDLPEKIKECGINVVKGFVDGVKEKYAWMKEQVNGFFKGVVAGVENTLDEHSPSRVFKKIGVFSAKGYVLGWEDVPIDKQVSANMKNSIGTIQANLKGTGTTIRTQQGIDYNRMGQAMAYAMERSGFKLEIGQREFGRIVREVMA